MYVNGYMNQDMKPEIFHRSIKFRYFFMYLPTEFDDSKLVLTYLHTLNSKLRDLVTAVYYVKVDCF